MKQIASLAWKEWHEVQWFFWVALFTFIGLPCIGACEAIIAHTMRDFRPLASPWVYGLGSVLAVFVAAGASCRDFQSRLEDFWQSRPLNVNRWLTVKYYIGLAVVIVPCVLPLLMEWSFDHTQEVLPSIIWLPFFWAAVYSITFYFGVLVRRTAHAAMLGLAAMFLLYAIPILVPPLQWLNIHSVIAAWEYDQSPALFDQTQLIFGAAMVVIAALARWLAILAVRRHCHVESSAKLIYGAISVAILVTCVSAAFRLSTNLPVLAKAQFPAGQVPASIRCDGNSGYLITAANNPRHPLQSDFFRYDFEIMPGGIVLQKPKLIRAFYDQWGELNTSIEYSALETCDDGGMPVSSKLFVLDSAGMALGHVPLWGTEPPWHQGQNMLDVPVWTEGKRLYVMGKQLTILDISDARSPKVISVDPNRSFYVTPQDYSDGAFTFPLPPLLELPISSRLRIALSQQRSSVGVFGNGRSFPHQIGDICLFVNGSVDAYRLAKISYSSAVFFEFATYRPSIVEDLFANRRSWIFTPIQQDGLCYVNFASAYSNFYSQINVYDARDKKNVNLLGHFAAPRLQQMFVLPDGRILAAGNGTLWLVGAPGSQS